MFKKGQAVYSWLMLIQWECLRERLNAQVFIKHCIRYHKWTQTVQILRHVWDYVLWRNHKYCKSIWEVLLYIWNQNSPLKFFKLHYLSFFILLLHNTQRCSVFTTVASITSEMLLSSERWCLLHGLGWSQTHNSVCSSTKKDAKLWHIHIFWDLCKTRLKM